MLKLTSISKALITLLLAESISFALALPVAAVTPKLTSSPSAKLSPTVSPTLNPDDLDTDKTATVNQNLKRMIDKVVEQNKEKVQARLQEIGSRRRGFVGEIKNIREGAITLRTKLGTQIIPTDQGVEMFKANKPITVDKISVGDWAVVIGATKDDEFIAETIEFLASSPQPDTQIVQLGTITELKKTSVTFQSRKNEETKTYTLTKNMLFQDYEGKKATAAQFSTNTQALLIAQENETGLKALIIRALAPFNKTETNAKN